MTCPAATSSPLSRLQSKFACYIPTTNLNPAPVIFNSCRFTPVVHQRPASDWHIALQSNRNSAATWSSEPTAQGSRPHQQPLRCYICNGMSCVAPTEARTPPHRHESGYVKCTHRIRSQVQLATSAAWSDYLRIASTLLSSAVKHLQCTTWMWSPVNGISPACKCTWRYPAARRRCTELLVETGSAWIHRSHRRVE
jgi:hypothetical protein